MTDSRIDKWAKWIDGRIYQEVMSMNLHRETYLTVGKIVDENEELPDSYFLEYLQDTYAATQAVAVRRQAETRPDVISLGRLLREISDDAGRVTRSFFVGLWDDDDPREVVAAMRRAEAEAIFDEKFAGDAGGHLDPAIARRDLEALAATAESLKTFVDKHLAHADARPGDSLPTFEQLHAAVDQIGEFYARYLLLLTAAGITTLVPIIQEDWLAIFRQPWIRP